MMRILLLVICCLLPMTALSDVEKSMSANNTNQNSIATTNSMNELSNQIQELKIQNDLLKEFQASLLSTVYWSLSFLGSITFLLLGYGWWSSSKIHEKDKNEIRQEFSSLLSEYEVQIRLDNTELLNKYESSNETKHNRLVDQLKDYEKEYREHTKAVEKDIKENLEAFSSKHKADFDSINERLETISNNISTLDVNQKSYQSDMFDIEERVWELRGVISNVLITQAQGLNAASALKNDSRIKFILERTNKTLKSEIEKPHTLVSSFSIEHLKGALNSLDDTYSVEVSEIMGLINRLKVTD